MQDGVAQHLDLAGPAVTGVDLQAAVGGVEHGSGVVVAGQRGPGRSAVGPHVGLDALQQGGGRGFDRTVVVGQRVVAGGEHELHLPGVASPRSQKRVARHSRRGVIAAAHDHGAVWGGAGDALPQHRRGVEEQQVHVARHR